MFRVVIDGRESGTSTGRYIDKLIEYLHKLQPEFEIIVLTKKDRIEYLRTVAPSFRIIGSRYKAFSSGEQFGLRRQIRRLKPDLVHFGMTQQPVLYFGKTITTVHDLTTARFYNPAKNRLVFKSKQWVYRVVIFIAAHKSKMVITASQYVKDDLVNFARIKPQKITVTYEAADKITEAAKPVPGLQPKSFLMYVGRPLPHKNLKRLMEAYSIVHHAKPTLKLALVGKSDKLYDRHQQWAKKQGIEGVVFTGFVTEGQLRWLYENAAAYVFPSLSEGFGLPGLEAMVHGCPVIASKATCLPEVYGQAAEYFDPLDIHDMVEAIRRVVDNPTRVQELIRKGDRQVEKYSWAKMAKETLEVYKQVLKS
ncbi:MAG: glycosyltransferase family 1 protein [Candidatus Saccharimonadales bacterium]